MLFFKIFCCHAGYLRYGKAHYCGTHRLPWVLLRLHCYKQLPQYQLPYACFSPGEYLFDDSSYGLSMTMVTLYKIPAANRKENKEFNYCLAKFHVRIERCIGVLKSRWNSLLEMRQQLRSPKDVQIYIR
ncbi:hypothetical protein BGZ96_010277 [Linnemannia gamsii]|uniref:DDE Tnp4 domain-containing protein n=1 Tax=Linnemannia gamsii TaxID=64522 RepID=A0ABQ7JV26_9FUNG|nr:hypothetical protein BGZ96_010277 [Linnemannia gamsii]